MYNCLFSRDALRLTPAFISANSYKLKAHNMSITKLDSLSDFLIRYMKEMKILKRRLHVYNGTLTVTRNKTGYWIYISNVAFKPPIIGLFHLQFDFSSTVISRTWYNIIIKEPPHEEFRRNVFIQIFIDVTRKNAGMSIQERIITSHGEEKIRHTDLKIDLKSLIENRHSDVLIIVRNDGIYTELKIGKKIYRAELSFSSPLRSAYIIYNAYSPSLCSYVLVPNNSGSEHSHNKADITQDVLITWRMINPTEYAVHINSSLNEAFIVFSESYHEGWALLPVNLDNITIIHYKVNGYANGWYIKSGKPINGNFLLIFMPQKYYRLAWTIQLLLFTISCIGIIYTIIPWRSKQKHIG